MSTRPRRKSGRTSTGATAEVVVATAAAAAVTVEGKHITRKMSTTRAVLAEVQLDAPPKEEESDLTELEEEDVKPSKKKPKRAAAPKKVVRAKVAAKEEEEESELSELSEDEKPAKKRKRVKKAVKAKVEEGEEGEESRKKKPKPKAKKVMEEVEYVPRVESGMWVGGHVSAAGGVENAVLNAAAIGAHAFALFLKSQRKWMSPPMTEESISLFKSRLTKYGYSPGMVLPHGSYLINLGNPDAEKREKAYECFLDELQRCEQLGIELYNFHPGSTVGAPLDESLARVADGINRAHKATSFVCVLIENMAGTGNVMGGQFSDLAEIIRLVEDKSRVGVCLDTCHLFASGYDIRDKLAYQATMEEFDRVVGLKYLKAWHLNDSKAPLGSKKDRHENMGLGHIGLPAFQHILSDPRLAHMPMVLETPNFEQDAVWQREISVLYGLESAHKKGEEVGWETRKGEVEEVVKWAEGMSKKGAGAGARKKRKKGADAEAEGEGEDEGEHVCDH